MSQRLKALKESIALQKETAKQADLNERHVQKGGDSYTKAQQYETKRGMYDTTYQNRGSSIIEEKTHKKSRKHVSYYGLGDSYNYQLNKPQHQHKLSKTIAEPTDNAYGQTPAFHASNEQNDTGQYNYNQKVERTEPKYVKRASIHPNVMPTNKKYRSRQEEHRTNEPNLPNQKLYKSRDEQLRKSQEPHKASDSIPNRQTKSGVNERYRSAMAEDLNSKLEEYSSYNKRLGSDIDKLKVDLQAERAETGDLNKRLQSDLQETQTKEHETRKTHENLQLTLQQCKQRNKAHVEKTKGVM